MLIALTMYWDSSASGKSPLKAFMVCSPSLGLSREEIEAYGLNFQEELFTRPFIANWTLERLFGERADEIKQKYLNHSHDDIWDL